MSISSKIRVLVNEFLLHVELTWVLSFVSDEQHRVTNWFSIFSFHDATILKNIAENDDFPLDFNVKKVDVRIWICRVYFFVQYKPKYVDPEQDLMTITEVPVEPQIPTLRKEKSIRSVSNHLSKNNKVFFFSEKKEQRSTTDLFLFSRKVVYIELEMFWLVRVFSVFCLRKKKKFIEMNFELKSK